MAEALRLTRTDGPMLKTGYDVDTFAPWEMDAAGDLTLSPPGNFIVGGLIYATGFGGDGSTLTDLDAGEITAGELPDARLSANVPLLDAAANAFTGDMGVAGDLDHTGGRAYLFAPATAPTDGDLENNQVSPYLDESGGAVIFRVRKSDGTYASYSTADGGAGGASDLDDLTDVTLSSPAEDDVLSYNGSAWVNRSGAVFGDAAVTLADTFTVEGVTVLEDRVYLSAPATAPTDGDIAASQLSMYLDESTGAVAFRARLSGGSYATYKTTDGNGAVPTSIKVINVVDDHDAEGDGVTDDTTAIAAAVAAALAAGPGTALYFPPGSYLLDTWTKTLLDEDIVLLGLSARHTKIIGPDTGTDAFNVQASIEITGLRFETWREVFDYDAFTGAIDFLKVRDVEFDELVRAFAWNSSTTGDYIDRIDVRGLRVTDATGEAFEIQGYRIAFIDDVEMDGVGGKGIRLGLNDYTRASTEWEHAEVSNFDIRNVDGGAGSANAVQVYGQFASIGPGYIESVTNTAKDDAEGIYTKVTHGRISGVRALNGGHREGSITVKGNPRSLTAAPQGYGTVIDGCHVVYVGQTEHAWGITVATQDTLVTNCWVEGAAGPAYVVTEDNIDNVRFIDNGGLMGPYTNAGLQTKCYGKNQEYRGFRFDESATLASGDRYGILHRIEARDLGSQQHDAIGITYADNSFGPLTAQGGSDRTYGIVIVAFEKISEVWIHGNYYNGLDHAYSWDGVNDGADTWGEIDTVYAYDEKFTDIGISVLHNNTETSNITYGDFRGASAPA